MGIKMKPECTQGKRYTEQTGRKEEKRKGKRRIHAWKLAKCKASREKEKDVDITSLARTRIVNYQRQSEWHADDRKK